MNPSLNGMLSLRFHLTDFRGNRRCSRHGRGACVHRTLFFQPLNPHLHNVIVLTNIVSGLAYFDLISVSSFCRELATEKVREVVQAVLKEMTSMYS
jgi:hypothetical protein